MSFRLRSDARTWFAEIAEREPKKHVWDLYYFCLMIGLASGKKRCPVENNLRTDEMVGHFIDAYKPAQTLILGLLISAELKKGGIDVTEKAAVRRVIERLISMKGEASLTDAGYRAMNAYASGGFDFLTAARGSRPRSPEAFHRDFITLMDEAVVAAA